MCVCDMCITSLSVYLSVDTYINWHLYSFHVFATINNTSGNMGVHMSFWDSDFCFCCVNTQKWNCYITWYFCFIYLFIHSFINFLLRWVFMAVCRLSLVAASGSLSSHCWGFSSCCSAWEVGCVGFSSCGSWALECRLRNCDACIFHRTWNSPGSVIKPVSPAFAGRFLTPGALGKSWMSFNVGCRSIWQMQYRWHRHLWLRLDVWELALAPPFGISPTLVGCIWISVVSCIFRWPTCLFVYSELAASWLGLW